MLERKQKEETNEARIHIQRVENDVQSFQKREKIGHKNWSIVTILFFIYAAVFFCSLFFVVEHSAGSEWIYSPAYVLDIIRQNLENFL